MTNGQDGWVKASFEELPHAAASIMAAEREAEAIVRRARETAQEIEQEAYREGYGKGQHDAMDEMQRQFAPLEAVLQQAHTQVTAAHHVVASRTQDALIDLTMAMATHLVLSELDTHPEAIMPIIRAALEAAGHRTVLAVRVNPGAYAVLTEHRGELPGSLESARLVSDPALSPGGCLIEVENGLIDARLESQLQEAARLLGRKESI